MKRQILVSLLVCTFLAVFAGGQMVIAAEKIILWDVQTTGNLMPIIDNAAKEFNAANKDVQLEVVHILNDPYKTKIKVAMGAKTPPDIFHNWGGGPLKEYIDSGMVATIDEIKADLLKTYIPAAFDPATFDGKTYAVPYSSLTGVYIWYRKDVFAQYKLTPPKTWAELINICETLKKNGIVPFTLANKNKWTGSFYYMYLADRVGGPDLFLNALYGKNKVTFEDPAYVKAGEIIQDWVKKEYFPKGVNGLDEDLGQASSLLYTKKAGMYLMGSWYLGNAKANTPDMMDQLDFFVFPAVEGGKGNPTNLIGSPGQDYLAVASTSKNKAAALNYLKMYMTPARIEEMVKGGYLPPVKGVSALVTDPLLKKIAQSFEAAGHVQVYYDQFMPPAMGEKHKDLVQALFGLQKTPAEVAKAHQEALKAEKK